MKKVNKKTCPTNLTGFIHGTDISECWVHWGTMVVKRKKTLTLLELTPMGNKNAHLSK